VALPNLIYLISDKQRSKVISQNGNFILFMICSHSKHKVVATSVASTQHLSLHQNKVNRIMDEYRDIFSSPTGVLTHYQVKHPIDLNPNTPLPNGPDYQCLLMENDEIRHQI
jgi:hypothetical protein